MTDHLSRVIHPHTAIVIESTQENVRKREILFARFSRSSCLLLVPMQRDGE